MPCHSSSIIARAKVAVARALCHPRIGGALNAVFADQIPYRGCLVDTKDAAIDNGTRAAIFWGLYEGAEVRFVDRFLRTDLDVVELGASIGAVSAHIARHLGEGRKLICVEANPALLTVLHSNIALNAPGLKAHVLNAAVAYPAGMGEVALLLGKSNAEGRLEDGTHTGGERIAVPAVTLSQVLEWGDVQGFFALVSDIEGAETGMILEEKVLSRCSQLVVELHRTRYNGKFYSVNNLLEILQTEHELKLLARRGPVCVLQREG